MTSPKQLAHFVLSTHRHEELIEWYTTLVDGALRFNNGVLAFISFDEEHHRIALANLDVLDDGKSRSSATGTLEHVAFTYDNIGDLLENYGRLRDKGYKPYWCINHGITFSMYFSDPDGNQVELQVDAFDDPEDANDFMRGPVFKRNPIGVEYDPDDMLERYRAGESAESLMKFDAEAPPAPIRQAPTRGSDIETAGMV